MPISKSQIVFAFLSSVMSVILTGCGGGGSSTDATGTDSALEKYVGSWSNCSSSGEKTTQSITPSSKASSVDVKIISQYFANADCTGTVAANVSWTSVTTITRTSDETVSIELPLIGLSAVAIDKVNINTLYGDITVTGAGVSHVNKNGQWQYCFQQNPDHQVCIYDTPIPTSSSTGALYTDGRTLYLLTKTGSTWAVASDTLLPTKQ